MGIESGPKLVRHTSMIVETVLAPAALRRIERPKITIEKLADHFAEPGVIMGETCRQNPVPARFEFTRQKTHLRLLAAAVDSFHGDKFSALAHQWFLFRALV